MHWKISHNRGVHKGISSECLSGFLRHATPLSSLCPLGERDRRQIVPVDGQAGSNPKGRFADNAVTEENIDDHFSCKIAICKGSSFSGSPTFESFRFSIPSFAMK